MTNSQLLFLELLKLQLDREHRSYYCIFPRFPNILLSGKELYVVGSTDVSKIQSFMIESFCKCYGIEIVFFPQ